MLFGSNRDFNLLTKINRELLKDIVEQEVLYYKLSLEDTEINIYGESLSKIFYTPAKLNCLITRGDQVINIDDFGPDLGRDSIKSGIVSLIVGFVLVILFMFYKYKIFGLIANLALVANLTMLIGVLTILEATLTLPGIAGIILTVGMAVDANVLIFERIKEELKTEKSIIHAFHMGYSKAKITVLDANITTLIAAIILFAFGSGPVKGFAITLGIGIITTLFSAYFLARHLTSIVVLNKKEGQVNL